METTSVVYSRDYVGNPGVVAIDRDRCAVADGAGNVTIIDLRSREFGPRLFVGVMGGTASNLRSLRRHPGRPGLVAVATRGAYAAIGDLDRLAVAKVHPVQGGTVQSVAFAPDGRSLAIGTGGYSASGPPQAARVEIWDLPDSDDEPPRFTGFAAMPGACVDAIAWSPDGALIACATGLRSQKSGFVAQLGADDLRARSFFEVPWAGAGRLCYVGGEPSGSHLAVGFKGGMRVLGAGDGQEAWRVDRPESAEGVLDFDVLPRERAVVLTIGRVLDAIDGADRSKFLAMNDCTSIAARPGGGYFGVSGRGRVYCWD